MEGNWRELRTAGGRIGTKIFSVLCFLNLNFNIFQGRELGFWFGKFNEEIFVQYGQMKYYFDMDNLKFRNRKLNRLRGYDYSQEGWYFVTICTRGNECFLGDVIDGKMHLSKIGQIVNKCWLEIPIHFPNVELDEFIIMPNHVHGIIVVVGNKNLCSVQGNKNLCSVQGNKNLCSLRGVCSVRGNSLWDAQRQWQTKWARSLSSIIRGFKIGVTKWCRQNGREFFVWHKSYYDHIIRNDDSLSKIREYIVNNPLKWEYDRENCGYI